MMLIVPDRGRAVAMLAAVLAVGGIACEKLPSAPASFGAPIRAVQFVDWTSGGYATGIADQALDALAATGANAMTLVVSTATGSAP